MSSAMNEELDQFEGRDREIELGFIPDELKKLTEKIDDKKVADEFLNALCHSTSLSYDFANQAMRAVAKTYAINAPSEELYKIRDKVVSHVFDHLQFAFNCYDGSEDVPEIYFREERQENLEEDYIDEVTSMAGYIADQLDETELILEDN